MAEEQTVKVKKKKDKSKAAEPTTAPSSGGDYNLGGPGTSTGTGDKFRIADHVGELLLISPHEVKEATTDFGTSEIVEADVVILNRENPAKSVEFERSWIFAKYVIGQLRDATRDRTRVVGGLIQDDSAKKAGQTAPYRLTAPSDSDVDVARRFLDSRNPLR